MADRDVNIKLTATDEASPLVDQASLRMERSLRRQAEAITRGVLTPTERYQQELKELKGHLDNARISEQTYNRQLEKTQEAYFATMRAEKERAQSLQKENEATKKSTADLGASGKGVFSSMVGGLASVVAGYASLQGAISFTVGLLRDQAEAAREAGRAQRQSEFSLAQLSQVSDKDNSLESLIAKAKGFTFEGGAADDAAAGQIVFALKSAGILDELPTFQRIASSGFFAQDQLADLSVQSAALYANLGREEVGSFEQLLNKSIVASGGAPSKVPELLSATARSGISARQLGLTDEEILAATALSSEASGSAAKGGTNVDALLRSLRKQGGFEGKSLLESLDEISGRKMSDAELIEFFGREEAATAFGVLTSNREKYVSSLGAIRAGESSNQLGVRIGDIEDNPELAAARLARTEEARELASRERLGALSNLADSVAAADTRRRRENRPSGMPAETVIAAENQFRDWGRFATGDEEFIRRNLDLLTEEQRKIFEMLRSDRGDTAAEPTRIPVPPPPETDPRIAAQIQQQREMEEVRRAPVRPPLAPNNPLLDKFDSAASLVGGMTVDAADLLGRSTASLSKLSEELRGMKPGLIDVAERAEERVKDAERERKSLESLAERFHASTRTDEERLAAERAEIEKVFKAGLIDEETRNRALKDAQEQFGPSAPTRADAGLSPLVSRFLTRGPGGRLDPQEKVQQNTAELVKIERAKERREAENAARLERIARRLEEREAVAGPS